MTISLDHVGSMRAYNFFICFDKLDRRIQTSSRSKFKRIKKEMKRGINVTLTNGSLKNKNGGQHYLTNENNHRPRN